MTDLTFKTSVDINNINLINFPMEMATTIDGEPEMTHSEGAVHFYIEIDAREYGVKDMLINVSMIEICVGDHEICIKSIEPCTINGVNDDQWDVMEESNLSFRSIVPRDITLDWETKRAEVTFK